MERSPTILRLIARWLLRAVGAALLVLIAWIAAVVYPSPLFAHQARIDGFRVYSDEPIPDDMHATIADVTRRIDAMEHPPVSAGSRVYLCNSRKRYAFFAALTRKSPDTLAIGLSVANESFVSMGRVEEFAAINQGRILHSRFEGNLAEVIAHEIAHFHSIHALGYRRHLALPVWKSEGWAEYQANLGPIRDDPEYDLLGRIDLLLDEAYWRSGTGRARDLWEWQLLVEFLGEVHEYRLEDLVRHDVTREATLQQMLAWRRSRD
ncbi:MAG: hypothetical protein GY716_07815 [bacterium]|nr:hypothetical protein [bacterium]